jgi:deoxyribodipyrimidine photo-lyase
VIQPERVQALNDRPERKRDYVLYWMQQSQREEYNHALEHAIGQANRLNRPLLVGFGLYGGFPDADERHYRFLLEGLAETRDRLARRGIGLLVRHGPPDRVAQELARDACQVVCDRGWLRIQRQWRTRLARGEVRVEQVESDAVVPVETASDHEEYAAATFRPRVMRQVDRFLAPLRRRRVRVRSLGLARGSLDPGDIEGTLALLRLPGRVAGSRERGGTGAAKRRLTRFLKHGLDCFADGRNDPTRDCCSRLSAYLHFGQVSPVQVARAALRHGGPGVGAFIEELVVRRELAINFCHYNDRYDRYDCLPGWARRTLEKHADDAREPAYSERDLAAGRTADRYWNACQRVLVREGRIPGYLRMYWGTKVIEWTPDPERAFRLLLRLNNRYELDGRDPNGFAGVAWCLGKHDRPWGERPVFGTVRWMSAAGLERKFDIGGWADRQPVAGSRDVGSPDRRR